MRHNQGEYVRGDVHANSIESVWEVLNWSIQGTWHHVSPKHLARYAAEAAFRLNDGNVKIHTINRMDSFIEHAFRRRMTYERPTRLVG